MEEKNYKKYIVFLLPATILLIVLFFTKSSFANPELTKTVYLYSEENNYTNNENNSWGLKKTAKWINDQEAEIEINVKSKPFDSNAHDYIFMVDLTGENNAYMVSNFYRYYLYTPFNNTVNNVTIIGYSENQSQLFVKKAVNPEAVMNAFDSMDNDDFFTDGNNVDYYDALLNLENVLSSYGAQDDELIKIIFVGKAYSGLTPNNQEEEFDYIKETFPNAEFYFANTGDITTSGFLNKKVDYIGNDIELLTAANVIDEFVVTDYIDTKYFEYEEVIENSYKFLAYVNCIPYGGGTSPKARTNSLKAGVAIDNYCYCGNDGGSRLSSGKAIVGPTIDPDEPCGEMTLEYQMNNLIVDEETGKITWDLSNSIYSTNATLRFKVKLKDEYKDSDEIFTTNTSTKVESDLNEIEESEETNESPELKLFYKVIYEGNSPSGCYFEPVVETYKAFSTVNALEAPTCGGYIFKGWVSEIRDISDLINPDDYFESGAYQYMSYEDWYDYMINKYNNGYANLSSTFEMPDRNLYVNGTWGKVNVDKHFEGDEYGNYALYSITQKSLVNATELDSPMIIKKSTVTQVSLDSLDAIAEYEVTAVNLSDINYRLEVSGVNSDSTTMDYEIVEEPIGVSANSSTKFIIRLKYKEGLTELPDNTNYSLQLFFRFKRDAAMFKPGTDVNEKIKSFTNEEPDFYTSDSTITRIARYSGIPDSSYLISDNLVSTDSGEFQDPIYMWYDEDNTTVYWYSPAAHVYYNYNASYFYSGLYNLSSIDSINEISTIYTTDMSYMFASTGYSNPSFTLDLESQFDTSNVINMRNMFSYTGYSSKVFTLDLGDKFDTSNVTNMARMFSDTGYKSTVFTLDLGDKFDTSNVTNMESMFSEAGYNSPSFTLDLGPKFDTGNVKNMSWMFSQTGYSSTVFTLDLGDKFDTSNVTNMARMFSFVGYNNPNFTELDLGDKFNTSKVTNMSFMFNNCIYLSMIYVPTTFVTTVVTDSSFVFAGAISLSGGAGTVYNSSHIDATYAQIDGGKNNPGYFTLREKLTTSMFKSGKVVNRHMKSFILSTANYSSQDNTISKISRYTNIPESSVLSDNNIVSTLFSKHPIYMWYDSSTTTIYWYCEDENVYYNPNSSYFYFELRQINSISNLNDISSEYVGNMSYMFNYTGHNSESFTLDLGDKFDTSNVTSMSYMFNYTGYISESFTLNLGDKFDTSNVTDMSDMFYYTGFHSTVFTLDLGDKFDTSSVESMRFMFWCTGFHSTVFTLDLGDKFDTSNVIDMRYMLSYVGYSNPNFTELDLGSLFDTSKVTNMESMFSGYKGTTIYAPPTFVTTAVTNSTNMFSYCTNLIGGSGTVFDSSHVDATYAHIDGGTSNPGYFTARN